MRKNDSAIGTDTTYSVSTSEALMPVDDTRNSDDYGSLSEPVRPDLYAGMSADVSGGVAAGKNFGGNTDADTDAGLATNYSGATTGSLTDPADLTVATKDMKNTMKGGVESAKTAIGDATDAAKAKTGELVEQAKTQVSALTTQATDKVKEQIGTQKSKAAEGLSAFTDVILQTASSLEEKGQAPMANAVSGLAEKVDDFAGYLQNKSVDELAGDITTYAKQNPQVFVGGAFVLGLALARFLKSSGKSDTGYAKSSSAQPKLIEGSQTSYTSSTGYVNGSDYAATDYKGTSTYGDTGFGANDSMI